jgi:hypothetical protein
MYNRYRKAAHNRDSRNVVRREAFVIGGIFDNRKLMVAILYLASADDSLSKNTRSSDVGGKALGSGYM